MKLRELVQNKQDIHLLGDDDIEITDICYDSREVTPGALFFALRGHSADGHAFIDDAKKRGARAIVGERDIHDKNITYVRVPDARRAMGKMARTFFHNPSMKLSVMGVTGTNGKTTVCTIVEKIIRAAEKEPGVIGTISHRYVGKKITPLNTTPESLDLLRLLSDMAAAGVTHAAMEVSSHALDQGRADPLELDAAVFTNLTQDHLDYHGTMEHYFEAKARLFRELINREKHTTSVINCDDAFGARLARETRGDVLTFGMEKSADIHASRYEADTGGVRGEIETPSGTLPFSLNLLGKHNIYNILAAVGGGIGMGLDTDDIARGINGAITVPGRLEIVEGSGEFIVLVDYAHTDDALKNVISTLRPLTEKRLITLFGCGGDRDREKRPLMAARAAELSDKLVITSDNPRTEDPDEIIADIVTGLNGIDITEVDPEDPAWDGDEKVYSVIPDRRKAIRLAIKKARRGDIVLIAGKGHEDYQIIGKTKHPFDDRHEAALALKERKRDG
jgi:UDP-N-acetylmuramoyl-L-alanyl-D-glutamate--2,6-diaminopimelate ligase